MVKGHKLMARVSLGRRYQRVITLTHPTGAEDTKRSAERSWRKDADSDKYKERSPQ